MSRVFTTATDDAVVDMISAARTRLAVIAPGVTTAVARALAARMRDLPELSLTVILDADPEVYRMGYGDTEALAIIREASHAAMFDLREQAGVRIGVIISDDQTMVYAPVSRNVEAGATSSDRPNAIVLGGKATEAVAVASGSAPPPESPDIPVSEQPKQEIGGEALDPARVKDMEADLQANPPRPFDLTRRLTVFVTEVQFVELRLSNAVFSSRKIRLLPHFLKFNDAKLRNDIDSTLKIPIDFQRSLKITFTSWRGEEEIAVNEGDLKRERDAIERTFFYDWKGRGKVILRKDKDNFRKELQRLIIMTTEYQNALKSEFEEHKKIFRERLVAEFLDFWMGHPPEHLRRRGVPTEDACKRDIEKSADEMFDKAVILGTPEAKDIYKDISIEDLQDEDLMNELKKLMKGAGVDQKTIEKLFTSGDAAAAQGSFL